MKARLLFFAIVVMLLPRLSFATHITSGDLTYVHNTGNSYTFSLTLYRDCFNSSTQFNNSVNLYIYYSSGFTTSGLGTKYGNTITLNNASGGTTGTTVAPYYYSPCLTFPSTLCVKKAVFTATVNLPATVGGYTAFAQVCCRNVSNNFSITTSTDGATYMVQIPGTSAMPDNSPQWTTLPPIAICQGVPFSFPCGATDADGDSLVYSLYTPYDGNNGGGGGGANAVGFNPLVWQGGYSLTNFVGGTPALAIDVHTGLLTCNPPNQGPYVVGIKIDQYRNGVYIGSIYRDVQFNINPCNTVVTAGVNNTSGFSYILSCTGKSITFQNTSTPINGTLTKFFWNFGDLTTSADTSKLQNPTYVYPDTGTYTVTYIMNPGQVGSCSDTVIKTVKVYNKPIVGFKNTIPYLCRTISFTDTSHVAPAPVTYKWSFGDGTTSTAKNPNHIYATGGNKSVKLVVTSASGCKDSITKVIVIPTTFPPALISAPPLTCGQSLVQFNAVNLATYYYWNFGDPTASGDTSLLANPSYSFSDTGKFTISLFINKKLPSTCWDTAYVNINVYPKFQPGFKFAPQIICEKTNVQFTDTSHASPLINYWFWRFGDGSTSTLQNPSHSYTTAGTYQVKLLVKNNVGCMDSITNSITILPPAVASITAPPLTCSGNTVSFQSATTAVNYQWNFGDLTASNDTSILAAPSYTYPDSGHYQITLILNSTLGGTCVDTATTIISVYSPFVANFNYTPTINCVNSSVQFSDQSSGVIMPNAWLWNFGDGNTSTLQNPSNYYSVIQNYYVKLVTQNSVGCKDSITIITPIYPNAIATITAPVLQCNSNTVNFQTSSLGGGYAWNFGVNTLSTDTSSQINPIYSYPDSGSYTASMILNPGMSGSCTDTAYFTLKVYAPFHAGFKYAPTIVCPGYPIQFTDTSHGVILANSWLWNFGDGATSTLHNPVHAYANSGTYPVKLFIQNSKGCMDSLTQNVTIHAPVPSSFGIIAPTLNCQNTVAFQSSVATGSYLWDFGEPSSPNNTSTFFNPTHSYILPGFYPSKLIVYPGTGCADTAYHTVNVEFGLTAAFLTNSVCVYDSMVFTNNSVGGSGTLTQATYYWGDGDSLVSMNFTVKHKYAIAGTYTVKLKVVNSWGCIDSTVQTVTVNPIPTINAGPPVSICNLDTVTITASGGVTYTWSPNYAISSLTIPNPKVSPDVTTNYFVHVISALGCAGDDTVLITNINPPSDGVILNETICLGDSIQLNASGGTSYNWSPTVALTNPLIANPKAFPQLLTTYQVRIATGNCVKYDTVILHVKLPAEPNAGPDITICKGSYATLHGSGGTFYDWSPINHLSYNTTANPVVYPIQTTTYTLTVIDTFRCLKPISDDVVVNVEDFKAADAGIDTSTVKNYPVQLAASGGISYHWQPALGLSDTSIANPMCQPPHDMTYILTVTSMNGCIDKDTIHVIVYDAATIYIPNAFTPNGDGLDDVFKPIYAGVAHVDNFTIYNRWGNVVFHTSNLGEGWDGRFNDREQEIGTYIWVIEATDVTGSHWIKKGNLTLIR